MDWGLGIGGWVMWIRDCGLVVGDPPYTLDRFALRGMIRAL